MNTLEQIKSLIHSSFSIDSQTLQDDEPLSTYGLDSLALAELLFVVEEHFGLDFPEARTDVNTLAGLAALIDELQAVKN